MNSMIGAILMAAVAPQSWVEIGASASGGGISNSAGISSSMPVVALDASARPVVAWSEKVSTYNQVYLRRWDGVSWVELDGSASGGGISATPFHSSRPSLALDNSGNPVVAWMTQGDSNNSEIYLKLWNGSAWVEIGGSASRGGISNTAASSTYPSLALDSAGRPVVAWGDNGGSSSDILLRKWDGTEWVEIGGSASPGGLSKAGNYSTHPSLALDASGNPCVTWNQAVGSSSTIYLRRWNGTSWGELGGSGSSYGLGSVYGSAADYPVVKVDPEGHPIVVWKGYANNNGAGGTWVYYTTVYLRRWNGLSWVELGGSARGGNGVSGTTDVSAISMDLDPLGNPVVAWSDSSATNAEIFLRRWTGSTWEELWGSATGGGVSATPGVSSLPRLAVSVFGTPTVAWYEGLPTDPGSLEIYVKRLRLPPTPPGVPLSLSQFRLDGLRTIPPAGVTSEAGLVISSRLLDINDDRVRLEVELRAAGTAFSGIATATSSPVASGETAKLILPMTANNNYHWQARAVDETGAASDWVSFGTNPDLASEIDFSRMNRPPEVVLIRQRDSMSGGIIDVGATLFAASGGEVVFDATVTDPDLESRLRLEVEIRPLGQPFNGSATAATGLDRSPLSIRVPLQAGSFHWQYRAVDDGGDAAEWRSFGLNPESEADFVVKPNGSLGHAGVCLQSAPAGGGSWAAVLGVLSAIVACGRRRHEFPTGFSRGRS